MLLLNQLCTIYEAAYLIRSKFKPCWKQSVHKKTHSASFLELHWKLNQKVCHKSAELHASPCVQCLSAPVMLRHQSLHAASRRSTLYWCNAQDCGTAWTICCHQAPTIRHAQLHKTAQPRHFIKKHFYFFISASLSFNSLFYANGDQRELFTRPVSIDDSSNHTRMSFLSAL